MFSFMYTTGASIFVGFATNSFYLTGAVFFSLNAIIVAIMDASDKIKHEKNSNQSHVPQTERLNAESNIKNSIKH